MEFHHIFNLNTNDDLYHKALTPKSCGGDHEFKILALYGDKILDLELIEHLNSKYPLATSGEITLQMGKMVNKRTLRTLATQFQLKDRMLEIHPEGKPSKNDLKEAVEALVGAVYKRNGYESARSTCAKLIELIFRLDAEQMHVFDRNTKGELLELMQQQISLEKEQMISTALRSSLPIFEDVKRVGGGDHNPEFVANISVVFKGVNYKVASDRETNKQSAERNAAEKMLKLLEEVDR